MEGWHRTYREWGNGRVIRGVVHYMMGEKALCGYKPHPRTEMVPIGMEERAPDCEKCVLRAGGYMEGRRW
jgi:hypothetical protein